MLKHFNELTRFQQLAYCALFSTSIRNATYIAHLVEPQHGFERAPALLKALADMRISPAERPDTMIELYAQLRPVAELALYDSVLPGTPALLPRLKEGERA
jgi:hypothetical protein